MITKLHGEERGQPRGSIQVVRTGRVEYLLAWDLQRALMDFLEGHWDEPDNGLGEVRGPRRHLVHT